VASLRRGTAHPDISSVSTRNAGAEWCWFQAEAVHLDPPATLTVDDAAKIPGQHQKNQTVQRRRERHLQRGRERKRLRGVCDQFRVQRSPTSRMPCEHFSFGGVSTHAPGTYSGRIRMGPGPSRVPMRQVTVNPVSPVRFDRTRGFRGWPFQIRGSGDPGYFIVQAYRFGQWIDLTNNLGGKCIFKLH